MSALSDQLTLEMKRVLPAARPAVFRAFSDPVELRDGGGRLGSPSRASNSSLEPERGYRIEMQPPDADAFFLTGQFREVEPPARLSFTFAWEDPHPDDVETLVELSFEDVGGSTEVGLTQGSFKTEERRALHPDGWGDSFDKLERLF